MVQYNTIVSTVKPRTPSLDKNVKPSEVEMESMVERDSISYFSRQENEDCRGVFVVHG